MLFATLAPALAASCIASSLLGDHLRSAANDLSRGAYYPALAEFNIQAALDESCTVGWCDGVSKVQGRVRAAVAYAGSAAAYLGYGEPEQTAEPLDRAELLFQQGVADAAIGSDAYNADQAGLDWVARLRAQRRPLPLPLCPK